MHQLFDSLEDDIAKGAISVDMFKESLDSIRATFIHQKKLVGHCNDLLQLNIVASWVVGNPKKPAITMERGIVEQLLESRIHHKQSLANGCITTVEYFLELAKSRYNEGRNTQWDISFWCAAHIIGAQHSGQG